MHGRVIVAGVLLLLVVSGIAGQSGTVAVAQSASSGNARVRIAVLDLKNESQKPDPHLARYFADRLTFELLAQRRYDLLDRGEIAHTLGRDSIPIGQDLSTDQILQVGKDLNVDIVVMGTISEYAEPDIESPRSLVGLYVKLLSAHDGSLLAMARYRRAGREDMVSLSEQVTYDIARALARKLKTAEKIVWAQRKAEQQTTAPPSSSSEGLMPSEEPPPLK